MSAGGRPRIVIAAGGTAGHVVPAIAVADALRAEGAEVSFVGGQRAEGELLPAGGCPLDTAGGGGPAPAPATPLDRLGVAGIRPPTPPRAARAVLRGGAALGAPRGILAP